MRIQLTPGALAFLAAQGTGAVTVSSVVISSCCAGPLPPEVKPGAPGETEGFDRYVHNQVLVWFDSLLEARPEITIDVKDFGRYRELYVQGWE